MINKTLLPGLISLCASLLITTQFVHAESLDWTWHNPLPQGNHLTDLTTGEGFVLAVGNDGTVLRSEDGESWDFVDIGMREQIGAAATGDGQVMIGGPGFVLSSSDGLTWTTVLDEDDRGYSFGIAYGDGVWVAVYDYYNSSEHRWDVVAFRSSDGTTWERVDSETMEGQRRVLDVAYGGDGRFLVSLNGLGAEDRFLISTDLGESWEEVTEPTPAPLNAISKGGGILVGVGPGGTIATSSDGFSWEIQHEEPGSYFSDVVFADGIWVVMDAGILEGSARVLVSDDGEEWQAFDLEGEWEGLHSIAYFKDRFLAAGYAGLLLSGETPSGMSGKEAVTTHPLSDIAYNGEVYVAVGGGYRWPPSVFVSPGEPQEHVIMSSPDLEDWTVRDTTSEVPISGVAYGNGTFVAVGRQGTVLTSKDGVEWTEQDSVTAERINAITYGDGYFVAVGDENYLAASANGVNWEQVEVPSDEYGTLTFADFRDVTYGNGRFVAVASYQFQDENFQPMGGDRIIHATDPFLWEAAFIPPVPMEFSHGLLRGTLVGVTHGTNGFVAFGYAESVDEYQLPVVLHSKMGEEWTYVEVDRGFSPTAISSSPGGYVLTGRLSDRGWPAAAYISPGGINWKQVTSFPASPPEWIWNLYHTENQIIAVGNQGAVVSSIAYHPFITRQPRSKQVFEGETLELLVEATDPLGGELDYQWFFDGNPVDDDERIGGSQTKVLVVEGLLADDAGNYSVEISNEEDTIASLDARVTVGALLRVSVDFDQDSPGWGEYHFNAIQDAIDMASVEDSSKISVEPGVYFETIHTSGKPVVLTGTDPQDADTVSSTVVDASQTGGEDSGPVVYIAEGEDNRTQVRGLTIRNADGGSGIEIRNSAPIIEYNRIVDNSSEEGGGIYARRFGGGTRDKLLIRGNEISGNFAAFRGGGVHLSLGDCRALLADNLIYNNETGNVGGGVFVETLGAITRLIISGNRVAENTALRGGGFGLWDGSSRNTLLQGNLITGNRAAVKGAGVFIGEGVGFRIEHSIIYGNQSPDFPVLGSQYHYFSDGTFVNNIVSENRVFSRIPAHGDPDGQSLMVIEGLDVRFNNFWNNRPDILGDESIPFWVYGNTNFEPLFADPENGDFRLRSHVGRWDPGLEDWVIDEEHSPLIAAGVPRLDGSRPNMGAYGQTEKASLPLDEPVVSLASTWPGFLSKVSGSPVRVVMARTGPLDDALPVAVDVMGDAEEGGDYSVSGTITGFDPGEASTFVTLMPVASEGVTGRRTIVYTVESSESFISGGQNEAVIPIYDHPFHDWVVENVDEQDWMDASVSGPLAVREGSRFANLYHAAFAMDDSVPTQRHLPEALALKDLSKDTEYPLEDGPLIRFTRPVPRDGLVYSLEVGEGPAGWWEPVPSRVLAVEPGQDGRTETVTITWDDEPQGIIPPWLKEADRLFFRIRVQVTGESVLFPEP